MKREPKYVDETLTWCNAQRKLLRKRSLKRLPKGEQSNGNECPCGRATGLWVGTKDYETPDGERLPLPRAVKRFVRAFDAGLLPQFIRGYKS